MRFYYRTTERSAVSVGPLAALALALVTAAALGVWVLIIACALVLAALWLTLRAVARTARRHAVAYPDVTYYVAARTASAMYPTTDDYRTFLPRKAHRRGRCAGPTGHVVRYPVEWRDIRS